MASKLDRLCCLALVVAPLYENRLKQNQRFFMAYWILKTEPNTYSIEDLQKDKETDWDGVRNYQARNFIKQMQAQDLAFFYHSNCKVPGIVGIMQICGPAIPDLTALNSSSQYFDPRSTVEQPRWYMVKVKFVEKFPNIIPLSLLKATKNLAKLPLLQRGNRLSIMPVTSKEWQAILKL